MAIALAPLLGAIEVIQIHVPSTVAEVIDPLLAPILMVILELSERWQNVRSNQFPAKPPTKSLWRARDVRLKMVTTAT